MIPQNIADEKTSLEVSAQFAQAIRELGISGLLAQCNLRKQSRNNSLPREKEKRTAFEVFQFLVQLVFQGFGLYVFLGSKKQDIACYKKCVSARIYQAIVP